MEENHPKTKRQGSEETQSPAVSFSAARFFWIAWIVGPGLILSILFFIWVERNCSLPWLPVELGWPWIHFQSDSLIVQLIWNTFLFLTFGLLHSILASAHALKLFSPHTRRAFYVGFSGLSLFSVMALWQNTGIIVWQLPLSWNILTALSLVLYWPPLFATQVLMGRTFDLQEFLGFRQINGEDLRTEPLRTDGIYGWVRHPMYAATIFAFVVTPFMSLDRLLLSGVMIFYLIVAIPFEERKLVRAFGESYLTYRKKVPAFIPLTRKGKAP